MGSPFEPDRFAPQGRVSRGIVAATCCAVALALPFVFAQGHDAVMREAIIGPQPDFGPPAVSVPTQTSPAGTTLNPVPGTPQPVTDPSSSASADPSQPTGAAPVPLATDAGGPDTTTQGAQPPVRLQPRQPGTTTTIAGVPPETTVPGPPPQAAPPVPPSPTPDPTRTSPTTTPPTTPPTTTTEPPTTTTTEPATTTTTEPPATTTTLPEPDPTTTTEPQDCQTC